MYIKRD